VGVIFDLVPWLLSTSSCKHLITLSFLLFPSVSAKAYLAMIYNVGLISVLLGFAIFILDMVIPDTLATFFGVDVLKDYEEFYPGTHSSSRCNSLHNSQLFTV